MANDKLIKGRIRSTRNIAQITRAMQMVAASKMKKATEKALSGRPYADKILEVTREFAQRVEANAHPLLRRTGEGKIAVVLLSTNKGLCGGLNSNLFRFLNKWLEKNQQYEFITVGKKGKTFAVRTQSTLIADFSETIPFTHSITALTSLIVEGFLNNTYKEVYVIYNNFISAVSQVPTFKRILPIVGLTNETEKEKTHLELEMLIEPSIDAILDTLLFHYLENQIRDAVLEAEASEHSARMVAMKNATDNAKELTELLTLEYNKARQQKITFEIADLVTARLAVE